MNTNEIKRERASWEALPIDERKMKSLVLLGWLMTHLEDHHCIGQEEFWEEVSMLNIPGAIIW